MRPTALPAQAPSTWRRTSAPSSCEILATPRWRRRRQAGIRCRGCQVYALWPRGQHARHVSWWWRAAAACAPAACAIPVPTTRSRCESSVRVPFDVPHLPACRWASSAKLCASSNQRFCASSSQRFCASPHQLCGSQTPQLYGSQAQLYGSQQRLCASPTHICAFQQRLCAPQSLTIDSKIFFHSNLYHTTDPSAAHCRTRALPTLHGRRRL